jgi:diguanylate cyclase (GGDEF)-like protein/PAS domain S-box-containing protein
MSTLLHILLLEDSPTDAELIERTLRKNGLDFVIKCVQLEDAFITALGDFTPDIVLSDYNLPMFSGKAALEIMRRDYPEIPLIVVTGALSDSDAVDLLESGAQDYVLKDRLARLVPAVRHALAVKQWNNSKRMADAQLRIAATAFQSQEGMVVTDACGTILRVNNAFTKMTGYTPEDVVGKNPRILNSGRQDAEFYKTMWKRIISTDGWSGEIWNRRKNGEIFPEHLVITAVKDADGLVTNYVGTSYDITQSKANEEEIRYLAFYDSLTGLPNRKLLLDRINQSLAFSARSGLKSALLFIDLDNFKSLNDTLGHDYGDMLLKQVAQRLISCVREGDTVARLGGDEFVIMLEDLSAEYIDSAAQTEAVAHKILAALNQPYHLGTREYRNTPSIGATVLGDNFQSADVLMKQADIAMYQAKKAGRNNLRFFDPKMQETVNARAAIEEGLYKALKYSQFKLYYQVQVNGVQANGRHKPLGAEALIRWMHPERGIVAPYEFISLAEESGLILSIGQWVLETACAQLKAWQQNALTKDFVLAVNVSAKQFRQTDFVNQIKAVTQRFAISPAKLKLELTESLLLENIEETILKMKALHEIGIHFSLDDFGTGYSSLQYLKRLPLDQLKIDQSFVRDIVVDQSDRSIVRTVIAMAKSLDMNVIAEGVETDAQFKLLLKNGCMCYQGYLFGKPLPIEEFDAYIRSGG